MFNLLSIIFGLLAAVLALLGLIPLLGWVNWIMLPIALIGLVLGLLAEGNTGRNLNIVIMIVGALRLTLGGGIL